MNHEGKQSIGFVLQQLRTKQNLTQEALALESGVSTRTVQRAEKNGIINQENVGALCQTLRISTEKFFDLVNRNAGAAPVLRLSLKRLTKASDLLKLITKKGSLQIGPEGEQSFDQPWGEAWLNIEDLNDAKYALTIAELFGFAIFGTHYQERLQKQGKTIYKPVSLIIAVSPHDSRIYKTANGQGLDYVVDSRRQLFGRLINASSNLAAWRENQLLSKLDGEMNVKVLDEIVLKTKKRIFSKARR